MWIKEDAGGANSGTLVPARVRVVNLSGLEPVIARITSGSVVQTVSGSITDISGAIIQLTSGTGPVRAVTLSGSIVDISGAIVQLASGTGPMQAAVLSGSIVDVSGDLIQLTSGTGPIRVVTLSGSIVSISGQSVDISGSYVVLASGGVITLALGSVVDVSGCQVEISGQPVSISGGIITTASGSIVDISGSFIQLSSGTGPIQSVILSGSIVGISGQSIVVSVPSSFGGETVMLPAGVSTYLVSSSIVSIILRADVSNAGTILIGTTVSTETYMSANFYLFAGEALAMDIANPSSIPLCPTTSGDIIKCLYMAR